MIKLLLLICCCAICYGGEIPSSQYSGLEYLYNSTNGSHWNWQSSLGIWNFSSSNSNPCEWQGVTCESNCDNITWCNVLELALSGYSMDGMIPEQINLLSNISLIDFSNNLLLGNSVYYIAPLHLLTFLDLSQNSLTGSISSLVSSLAVLSTMILSHNYFTGSIPSTLPSMHYLTYLDLSYNQLVGTIPTLAE